MDGGTAAAGAASPARRGRKADDRRGGVRRLRVFLLLLLLLLRVFRAMNASPMGPPPSSARASATASSEVYGSCRNSILQRSRSSTAVDIQQALYRSLLHSSKIEWKDIC